MLPTRASRASGARSWAAADAAPATPSRESSIKAVVEQRRSVDLAPRTEDFIWIALWL
jgi:hypothetical protein